MILLPKYAIIINYILLMIIISRSSLAQEYRWAGPRCCRHHRCPWWWLPQIHPNGSVSIIILSQPNLGDEICEAKPDCTLRRYRHQLSLSVCCIAVYCHRTHLQCGGLLLELGGG